MKKTDKNIIIAEWLGWKFDEWNMLILNDFIPSQPTFKTDLKFHNDWNWIMLCLSKVAKDRKKTLLGAMEIVGYTLSSEFRTINDITDLHDAIFNYINIPKSDF